jgi:hypothetical protein
MSNAIEISCRSQTEPFDPRPGFGLETRYCEIDRRVRWLGEKLRTAKTGREAILNMLHAVLSTGNSMFAGPSILLPVIPHGGAGAESSQQMSGELRLSLRNLIRERLERSVFEGELPENADIEALTCLCTMFASGLTADLQDGIAQATLANSIALFVESVGFHRVKPPKRRSGGPTRVLPPVITLVKR